MDLGFFVGFSFRRPRQAQWVCTSLRGTSPSIKPALNPMSIWIFPSGMTARVSVGTLACWDVGYALRKSERFDKAQFEAEGLKRACNSFHVAWQSVWPQSHW